MDRPIIVGAHYVRPMAADGPTVHCMGCMLREGRWRVGAEPNDYVSCAFCFLISSPWGKDQAERIRQLVGAVEEDLGYPISADGVVLPEHSDRVLSSIVIVSRLAAAKRQTG